VYRRLEGRSIVETVARLERRIGERFPGSGLGQVSAELLLLAQEATRRAVALRRPNLAVRSASWALILLIVGIAGETFLHFRLAPRWDEVVAFVNTSQAIQNVVFLGIAVLFLANVETRIKRRRALAAIHELRSVAHIVDMHQLTKNPDQLVAESAPTASAPSRVGTRLDLSQYLAYCTELLSLTTKVAALYVQEFEDRVVLEAVNDVETLATGLSTTIWQKIIILDRMIA
jgi:hypothetical protein